MAIATSADELLPAESEMRAFRVLRWRIVRSIARQVMTEARFRAALIFALSALLWLGLFLLFVDGLRFLGSVNLSPDLYLQTVSAIISMFFAALLVMLFFSSGIILYSSLFRSRETLFLLTFPARVERVFVHKFHDAVLFSSWGFILLGSPVLAAYGVTAGAPWYYYALTLPFILAFIYVPAAWGAACCLLIMDRFPGSRRKLLAAGAAAAIVVAAWSIWSTFARTAHDFLTVGWFQEMLGRLQISQGKVLPSWWLTAGLLAAAEDLWAESVKFLFLLVANALFFRQIAVGIAEASLRRALSAMSSAPEAHRIVRSARRWQVLERLLAGLPLPVRLFLIKDLRIFCRDPLQWSQFLIFFGLLGLYFLNIRRFSYNMQYAAWVNMLSFLNLTVVGLLMSTFTTRFVYPMISVEGQRFWLLGLLPIRRDMILWSKFTFAALGTLPPSCLLVFLSDVMLDVDTMVLVGHQITCLLLCVGLAGIAVGLGARLPNLREESPSRIAAGFGGTLNLVVSTLYIVAIVVLTAVPAHCYLSGDFPMLLQFLSDRSTAQWWLRAMFFAGMLISVVLAAIATILPMAIGLRAFRRLDF